MSWRANEEVGGGEGHGRLSLTRIESEPWVYNVELIGDIDENSFGRGWGQKCVW